jgi:hypothetical protein
LEIFHSKFDLTELSIDKGDIERLMGYDPGESPDPFPETIEQVYNQMEDHCAPEGGFTILDAPDIDLQENQTRIGGQTFLTDKIVTRMLRKSEKLALFICTAGGGIEKWAKEQNGTGDPVKGFVIDAFGSEIADAAANKIQSIIGQKAGANGHSITNRYSPGYCDWPVKNQQELFSFFPEKFCGISLSASCMMHPIKSVSGVIGIGPGVKYQSYICDTCKDEHCIYRRLSKTRKKSKV